MRTGLIVTAMVALMPAITHAEPVRMKRSDVALTGTSFTGNATQSAEKVKRRSKAASKLVLDETFYAHLVSLLNDAASPTGASQTYGTPGEWLPSQFAASHLTPAQAASLQLAIRNALFDNGYVVNTVSGDVGAFYRRIVSSLKGAQPNVSLRQLLTVAVANGQLAMVTRADPEQITDAAPVPEPATLLLVGFGAAALAVRRRMRNRARPIVAKTPVVF